MKDNMTIGEKYGPAMTIKTQAEADSYFQELVSHSMRRHGKTQVEAEAIERSNLGYYAGYYNNETRERVERLFSCAHPIFGTLAQRGAPSAQEAFSAGVALASQ